MGIKLSYAEYGEGPPLIILHGMFGSARNWNSVAKRIAASRRVYAVDLRNHGNSPWADAMTYHDLAEESARIHRGTSARTDRCSRSQHGRQDRDGTRARARASG
ncbi:MAG: alpha/beta fold hydrolase [Burkholderiales bacterium]